MITKTIALLPGDGVGGSHRSGGAYLAGAGAASSAPALRDGGACLRCGRISASRRPLADHDARGLPKGGCHPLGSHGVAECPLARRPRDGPRSWLREKLDLYAGVRPSKLYHPAHSPLRNAAIDYVMIRESTEGLFSTRLRPREPNASEVRDELLVSRAASERLFHFSFRLALTRRKRPTLMDKANVLPSMAFFREIFDEVAREYPEVGDRQGLRGRRCVVSRALPERYDA